MSKITLQPRTTAVLIIDLQNSIVSRETYPYSPKTVVENSKKMATRFRRVGGLVVYVHVDLVHFRRPLADEPVRRSDSPPPREASELVPDSGFEQEKDLLVTKSSWGAFEGTDLEQRLREKGIKTVIMCGIATNYGVESTARSAYGLGFDLVFAEDAMASMSEDLHRFAVTKIFPRIGRVRKTEEIGPENG